MSLEKYKRLTDVDHVLCRSGVYLGSIINTEREAFVVENDKIVLKTVSYNPAIIKMFDEIISNSADESIRSGNVKNIKVTINDDKSITVSDDGGIPVELHPEYNIHIPELLFGELRSGSNFDDDNRTTAGMNGMGSVLVNIFSKTFKVETCDGKKKFTQTYYNNLSEKDEPTIKSDKTRGTSITFLPDYDRLKCELDSGNVSMIERRCYDIAANFPNVNVYFNGKKLSFKKFADFCDMFVDTAKTSQKSDDWEVVVTPSMNDDMFRHVSFVNGIDTFDGGTHVDYVANQITSSVREYVKKKYKIDVKPNTIKQCLFIFVRANINAPMFTSQTKERLINDSKSFDNPIVLTQKTINDILKSDIVQKVLDWAENEKRKQELAELRKLNNQSKKSSLKHILKFDDASTKDRKSAMLFLAEGDSAAATIKAARKSNPNIGVFALRGKVLNVRNATKSKILENEEIKNLMAITGLQLGVNTKKEDLYFQKIVIASDFDGDGHHICGLLCNLFGALWPDLMRQNVLYRLKTPIIVAKTPKESFEFFNLDEYHEWEKKGIKHTPKYFKGLGSWKTSDFERFLSDEKYVTQIVADGEGMNMLEMVFGNNRSDDKKWWLR